MTSAENGLLHGTARVLWQRSVLAVVVTTVAGEVIVIASQTPCTPSFCGTLIGKPGTSGGKTVGVETLRKQAGSDW